MTVHEFTIELPPITWDGTTVPYDVVRYMHSFTPNRLTPAEPSPKLRPMPATNSTDRFAAANLVDRRKRKQTGSTVSIFKNGRGDYTVLCETHSTRDADGAYRGNGWSIAAVTMDEAWNQAVASHTWCRRCTPVRQPETHRPHAARGGFTHDQFIRVHEIAFVNFATDPGEVAGEMSLSREDALRLLQAAVRRGYLCDTLVNGENRVWQSPATYDDHTLEEARELVGLNNT